MPRSTEAVAERAAAATADVGGRTQAVLGLVMEADRHRDPTDMLAAICRKTVEIFECQRASVWFYSRRHDAFVPLADQGTPAHVAMKFVTFKYDLTNLPHVHEVAEGRTVVVTRGRSPADDELLDFCELHTVAIVPLRTDDDAVRGMLNVGLTEGAFSEDDLRALEFIALHAAHATVRARALRATAEAARFRAAVSALAVELAATPSRARNLERLFAHGCAMVGAATAVLLVRAGDELLVAGTAGDVDGTGALPLARDAFDPVVRALTTRTVVLENDRSAAHELPALAAARSLLAIPLVADDEPLGVLVFGDHRAGRFASGVAEEAPVLGSLAAATVRNLEVLAKLQDANEQLRRVGALKDQFLANVSHDLRTPLNVIIGYAQLAIEETFGAVDDAQRDVWTRVVASARQQLALVEDLLDISRLELGTLAVTLQPVAIAPLFEEMKFVASTLVRQKDVRVRIAPVAPGLTVHADPNRMRQILTNLLSNAAKFTDVGEIELTAVAGDGAVRIAVRDTGPGIDPQHHELVFEPFRQVAGERAMLGAGLGLAIARHLATLMHGTLGVVSAVGRGSTFSLSVPAATEGHPSDSGIPRGGDRAPARLGIG